MTIIAEEGDDIKILEEAFLRCSALPRQKNNYGKKLGQGVLSLFKMPWNLTAMVIISLEKISDGAKATPNILTLHCGEKEE